MNRLTSFTLAALLLALLTTVALAAEETVKDNLAATFAGPPSESRPWCYWWWLNGAASKEGITRDFEEMKSKGTGGALLFDAGDGGAEVPRGPRFMSAEWRELFKHALREAERCGIVLTVNLCSGWDCGGPWVTQAHAAKKIVSTQTMVTGGGQMRVALPKPLAVQGFYRDIAVLAVPVVATNESKPTVSSSQPGDLPAKDQTPDKQRPVSLRWNPAAVVDLTRFVAGNGQLNWDAPAGGWKILRIGYTLHDVNTVVPGSGPAGPEIDPMSADAMDLHFAETGAKLIADAGPLAGKTLQYFHIDSWEIRQPNWTPKMREEFLRRRGYDLLPWLPVLVGQTLADAAQTGRFIQDYRRTIADLVAENYYGRMAELSVKGGLLGTHSESGGPGNHWIDALQCEGKNAVPMGEFWNRQFEPDGPISLYGPNNYTVKQAAAAAHIYGRPVCQAEAFTSRADDFTEDPWCMKDLGDSAFCDGLTRMVFHNWPTHLQPELRPGYWWVHIGVHFGYNLTWWPMADGWLTYLARCQHMLRQGLFVADFAYLQSEAIPNFTANRSEQQPSRPAGFDYDPVNTEVLLTRASAKNGRLTLPDGMSYRYLVLPHQNGGLISPDTLKKINELADAGVTVIGPKAFAGSVPKLREGMLDAVVKADNLMPDIVFQDPPSGAKFDWIHRRDGGTDIYFLSNQSMSNAAARVVFRVGGQQPELWDAVTGEIRDLPDWHDENGCTVVPLEFAPRQSWFVVFRESRRKPEARIQKGGRNFPELKELLRLAGPWEVQFDQQWFYPDNGTGGKLSFGKLEDWSKRPEPAVHHFSGIATYRKTFSLPSSVLNRRTSLDLGVVKNLARVRLNGRNLGVVWTAPWRVEIPAGLLKPADNALEIEVANLWPNRLIGDSQLAVEQRRTVSNVRTYDAYLSNSGWVPTSLWGRSNCRTCKQRLTSQKPAELLASGLLGPVTLRATEEIGALGK